MTSTYTANQGIEKPATGDQSGAWGATVNTNMDIIDRTVSGVGALTLTGTTTTLTTTDGTLTDGMYRVLVLGDGGDLGGNNTITLSPNDQDKTYLVYNNLSADRSAIFTQGTGANATVQNGETAWVYADGAGSGAVVRSAISSVKIADQDGDTQIQIEEGGDDDDTIRFDLAGAEDFTMTANSLNVLSGSVIALPDGAVATPSITNTGDLNTGVYFPAADTVGVTAGGVEKWRFGSNTLPSRNLVINGAMNVAQRGTSVTGAGAASGTLVQDQFIHMNDAGTGRYTVTQTADGPVGFANCLKIDCTTADTSLAANVLQRIETRLEAQNLQHLAFGNAAAKTITLSFYVKCTSTGTMSVLLQQQDGGRSYHQNYTIDSTDTWERKTLVFSGDASGGMNDDNGIGFSVYWTLTSGTDFQGGTSGSWTTHNNNLYGTSGDLNVFGSTATNWFMTGVQLEVGGIATDFEHEDYSTTLRKCQRYYLRYNQDGSNSVIIGAGFNDNTTSAFIVVTYPVPMRTAAPTQGDGGTVGNFSVRHKETNTAATAIATTFTGGGSFANVIDVTVSSGLTQGQGCVLFMGSGSNSTYLDFSSEL